MWASSVWFDRRNFLRAGTLKNRSRTLIVVPTARATSSQRKVQLSTGKFDRCSGLFVVRPGLEQQTANGVRSTEAPLAAKTERGNREEILDIAQLAGGMALKCQQSITRIMRAPLSPGCEAGDVQRFRHRYGFRSIPHRASFRATPL